MTNNIQVEITPDDFDKIQDSKDQTAIDKKLGLIFKVVSTQQNHCKETVERIEKSIKDGSATKINKVKAGGAMGGFTGLGVLIDRIFHYFSQ